MEQVAERATEGLLRDGLEELGLDPAPAPRLAALCGLLAAWGARLNLTAHRTEPAVARHLVLDAAALLPLLPDASPAAVVDLGSGAGFPGLPIAVLRPGWRVWLVESRARRHHFQRAAVRALGIANATPLLGRAEALDPERCGGAIAQAVSGPAAVGPLARPWLAEGGWLALPRSPAQGGAPAPPGFGDPVTRPYAVPGGRQRALWVARATA